jgi:hypothetical protein
MSTAVARSSTKPQKAPPEKKIGPFAGGVGVSIWLNRIESDQGPRFMRSITLNPRRYFDQESQQWKDAPSYNPADLPSLIFALQKSLDFCHDVPLPGVGADAGEEQFANPPEDETF